MKDLTFANPDLLYLLAIIPLLIAWYIIKYKNKDATIQVSSVQGFKVSGTPIRYYLRHLLFAFRMLVISILIVVLARPQSTNSWQNTTTEGIDIMLALDISSSMLAMDFQPNRLEASKNLATEFISGRDYDRIGLVVFSGESFTQCPLTNDHAVLINLFRDIESGMIEDGTAIGLGLANAINRLKESEAKSKVVILLTDGVNNRGEVAPITAAEIARTFGIRVYTIGVGSLGEAPYPVQTVFGTQYQNMKVEIDEETLQEIANITDGQYFRATNNEKLKQIYQEIDKLEKSKIEVQQFNKKSEEYFWFAALAAILLVLELALRNTILRSIP